MTIISRNLSHHFGNWRLYIMRSRGVSVSVPVPLLRAAAPSDHQYDRYLRRRILLLLLFLVSDEDARRS